jgi:hypothetical protein
MTTHRYLTLPEAARLMRSSKSKLRNMQDGPPRFRAPESRAWLYPADELIAWIERGRNPEPPEPPTSPKPKPTVPPQARTTHRNPLYHCESDAL